MLNPNKTPLILIRTDANGVEKIILSDERQANDRVLHTFEKELGIKIIKEMDSAGKEESQRIEGAVVDSNTFMHTTKNGAICVKYYTTDDKKDYKELVIYPDGRITQKEFKDEMTKSCAMSFDISKIGFCFAPHLLISLSGASAKVVEYTSDVGQFVTALPKPAFIETCQKTTEGEDIYKVFEFSDKKFSKPIFPKGAKVARLVYGHNKAYEADLPGGVKKYIGEVVIVSAKGDKYIYSKKHCYNSPQGLLPMAIAVGFTAAIIALECVKPFLYLALAATAIPAILAVVLVAAQLGAFVVHHAVIKDYNKPIKPEVEYTSIEWKISMAINIAATATAAYMLASATGLSSILLLSMAALMLVIGGVELISDYKIYRIERFQKWQGEALDASSSGTPQ